MGLSSYPISRTNRRLHLGKANAGSSKSGFSLDRRNQPKPGVGKPPSLQEEKSPKSLVPGGRRGSSSMQHREEDRVWGVVESSSKVQPGVHSGVSQGGDEAFWAGRSGGSLSGEVDINGGWFEALTLWDEGRELQNCSVRRFVEGGKVWVESWVEGLRSNSDRVEEDAPNPVDCIPLAVLNPVEYGCFDLREVGSDLGLLLDSGKDSETSEWVLRRIKKLSRFMGAAIERFELEAMRLFEKIKHRW